MTACAEDLGELADLLQPSGQRISYEFLSWSITAPTWDKAWDMIRRAYRSNLGLCIDTFHIIAIEWADPTTASGRLENPSAVANFAKSLKRLAAKIPGDKIFSVQLGDAYELPSPFDPTKFIWPTNLYWVSASRCKPTTGGGFLPVAQDQDAIMKTGFNGPISLECFDGGKDGITYPLALR
jgi:sugar phosphate isomerase/epimerase